MTVGVVAGPVRPLVAPVADAFDVVLGPPEPGDWFEYRVGELSVINRAERSATVIAETPLRCLMIAFWDFRKLATAYPDVLWTLLEHLAEVLAAERARRELAEARDH